MSSVKEFLADYAKLEEMILPMIEDHTKTIAENVFVVDPDFDPLVPLYEQKKDWLKKDTTAIQTVEVETDIPDVVPVAGEHAHTSVSCDIGNCALSCFDPKENDSPAEKEVVYAGNVFHFPYYVNRYGKTGKKLTDVLTLFFSAIPPFVSTYADWATAFVNYDYDVDGNVLLRRYREDWYEYRDGCWQLLPDEDLEAEVTNFLQNSDFALAKQKEITPTVSDAIIQNLDASHVCHVPSTLEPPIFLHTGKPAGGWAVMKNAQIQQEMIAAALDGKVKIPENAVRPLSPDLFALKRRDYDFQPDATCPRFRKYLDEVLPDPEQQEHLQMMTGLMLVPDMSYNVVFVIYGEGGTGKSVFLACLEALVGKESCCSVAPARLAERFDLAATVGKLVDIVPDMAVMSANRKSADLEGVIKAMTSGDIMRVEEKYKPVRCVHPTARLVMATNTLPQFTDPSNGIYDRLRFFAFDQVFRGTKKQNPGLINELLAERPGILLWALEGLGKLRHLRFFPESKRGLQIKAGLRAECDPERTYLLDNTQKDMSSCIPKCVLYESYKCWCDTEGVPPKSPHLFFESVFRLYPSAKIGRKRVNGRALRTIQGIMIAPAIAPEEEMLARGVPPDAIELVPPVNEAVEPAQATEAEPVQVSLAAAVEAADASQEDPPF